MNDAHEHPQLDRLAHLLAVLTPEFQQRSLLLEELAEHYPPSLDSARRVFERDIDALRRLGFLINKEDRRPPRYALHGHNRSLALSYDEVDILTLVRDAFGDTHPRSAVLQALLQRVTDHLPAKQQAIYAQHSTLSRLISLPVDDKLDLALIDRLKQAISAKHMIHFAYQSSGRPTLTRHPKVEPYDLEYYEQHLYLVGYSHLSGWVHDFRVDRIHDEVDFGALHNNVQWDRRRSITFRYRASSLLARAISQRFEDQHEVARAEDGSVTLEAKGRNEFFIIQALMRYRSEVELLSPDYLRTRMRQEIEKMRAVYEESVDP
ncbi:MAG: WYL domain-containing protein [Herpetosiphonaceae bacterium]|nr:WYL domain-containing protein [Herpetosiphonaceae bacterium]